MGKARNATFSDNRRDKVEWGNGVSAKATIEGAARQGWLDAIACRGYSPDYTASVGQWQRNYEAGRQWATAIIAIGLTPADWSEGARVPATILNQLAEVRSRTGSGTRPEDYQVRPPDDPAPLRAFVPVVTRRGRIVERLTT
jgi:hypothetical protein